MRALQAFCLALAGMAASTVQAAEFRAGSVVVQDPWARATAPHMPTGATFMVLVNTGTEPDKLVGASSPAAERVELHTNRHEHGVMQMREMPSIEIGANSRTPLTPGELHLMLVGLRRPLAPGESFPLTLTFERAGSLQVDVEVAGAGAMEPPHPAH